MMSWSVWDALFLLAACSCAVKPSCILWSSTDPVVQLGSSFRVYCTFSCTDKKSMKMYNDSTLESYKVFNASTIYLDVVSIMEKRTYSCQCSSKLASDPCGLDILAGYPPDRPKNISCIFKKGNVLCSWDRGRDTNLRGEFMLWVKAFTGNGTEGARLYNVSRKGTAPFSASFTPSTSVQLISVWVQAHNALGSVASATVNFTLSQIEMPSRPALHLLRCFSRACVLQAELPERTRRLQIQSRGEQQQDWTTYPESSVLQNPARLNVSSLEPFRGFHFRVRSRFSGGLWSRWSPSVFSRTQEEAPSHPVDMWIAPASDSKTVKVFWKETNLSNSHGRILNYSVRVDCQNHSVTDVVSTKVKSKSVPLCADCRITVRARNSKGSSPPASVAWRRAEGKPLQGVRAIPGNQTITISWRGAQTAAAAYVVEWYPEGRVLEDLRWVRLDRNQTSTVITDVLMSQCYEGAVYAVYNESSVGRTQFARVATLESEPKIGPSAQQKVERSKVTVSWTELPRDQRKGCITSYTIYLKNSRREQLTYSALPSQRSYVINDLTPDSYTLWMSASTAKGEGPPGQKTTFYVLEEDPTLPLLLMCAFAVVMALFTCLWRSSVVRSRLKDLCRCMLPAVVPDPANSKWAKECTEEKGKVNFQLLSGNSTFTEKEDETTLVNVEELFKLNVDALTSTDALPLGPETEESTRLYPGPTTYIKSLSHDSDSSAQTHASLDTGTTGDYIPSRCTEHGASCDPDVCGDELPEMCLFSGLGEFTEPTGFGGKLTLDTVKIDCSDFFQ